MPTYNLKERGLSTQFSKPGPAPPSPPAPAPAPKVSIPQYNPVQVIAATPEIKDVPSVTEDSSPEIEVGITGVASTPAFGTIKSPEVSIINVIGTPEAGSETEPETTDMPQTGFSYEKMWLQHFVNRKREFP